MKTWIFLNIAFFLLLCYSANSKVEKSERLYSSSKGIINVNVSPDLDDLATQWADEYQKMNSLTKISVNNIQGTNISELLGSEKGFGFISGAFYSEMKKNFAWNMIVGRNVIVPFMNVKNPRYSEISTKGIAEKELIKIIGEPKDVNLKGVNGKTSQNPWHLYVVNDPAVLKILNEFQSSNQSDLGGIQLLDTQEMIRSVQNDPYAIGICKLVQFDNQESKEIPEGLKLIPIDRNGNGKLDYMEDIYGSMESFARGVWIGKYPKSLSINIYAVSATKPSDHLQIDFLKWVITDGQKFLRENGFSNLIYNEQIAQLAKFDEPELYASVPIKSVNTLMSVLLLALIVIIVGGVIVELIFRRSGKKEKEIKTTDLEAVRVFNEESLIIPKGLYFDKTHSWAFMKKNGSIKVGIDDFLQHVTGKITRIEMRNSGDKIKKGDRLLSLIHKGKQLHIYSPISGTIVELNEKLAKNASIINSDPYSEGWVYVIEPINWGLELQYLMGAENFKAGLKEEFQRLKDFFASVLKSNSPEYAFAVMQDGGSLQDNPLAEFGPDVWDDFQTKFIDAK